MRRWPATAAAVLAAAVLSACQLTIQVGIEVDTNGSGEVRATITLDEQAAARLRATGAALAADDLRAAGWRIVGPTDTADGGAQLVATKRFARPEDLAVLIDEVAGPRRPLRDFRLERSSSLARHTFRLDGVVDLTAGVDAFGDDELAEDLGGDADLWAGEIERQAGTVLERFFTVRVVARLPGDVTSNAPSELANGAVWEPSLGERVSLAASSRAWRTRRVVAMVVALGTALALAGLLTVRVRQRRHHSRARPS